jgi:predicted Zn-dependent peptidase
MLVPNRKKGPGIITDYKLDFPAYQETRLSNGVPMFEVNSGTQEIVKIDLVFKVGRINETKRASAKACMALLREGTPGKNSSDLAYQFDYYGAEVKVFSGLEHSHVSLVCLNKYLDDVWPDFMDMVHEPIFSEEELEKYKAVTSQKLLDQISKNDVLSYRKVTELIFGENHPYGYNTQTSDIESLTRDDLQNYWNNNIGINHAFVVLSGKYDSRLRNKIISSIEGLSKSANPRLAVFTDKAIRYHTEKIRTTNEAQTSLKIGRRMFGRTHEDYTKVQVLNTVLGGYFGSRLMKNIREEKGYTYGIYSSIDVWKEDGFFYISAEVANQNVEATMREIFKEIDKLKRKGIEKEEFEMVKNYMLGQMLHLIDGPFATAQLIKNIYTKDIEVEHFRAHVAELKAVSQSDILEMANKYLHEKTFTTVLAGKIK